MTTHPTTLPDLNKMPNNSTIIGEARKVRIVGSKKAKTDPSPKIDNPVPEVEKGLKKSLLSYIEMNTVLITRGLASSDTHFSTVKLDVVEEFLTACKDSYERTMPVGDDKERVFNRVYIDLDGKVYRDMKEDEFNELHDNICGALNFAIEDEKCIMTSSQFASGKLSYRIHYTKKHGTKKAISHYVMSEVEGKLREALKDYLPITACKAYANEYRLEGKPYLEIDIGVYKGNRKMRMLGSSKDGEDRPLKLVDETQSVMDTLITYIPADSVLVPEPVEEVKPKKEKPTKPAHGEPAVEDATLENADSAVIADLLTHLAPHRYGNYDDFITVGFICFNEGIPMNVWEDWAKQSAGYKGDCAKFWKNFKHGKLSQATLWKWLKTDNPAKFMEINGNRNDIWKLLASPNHAEIAKYFYNMKPDAYLFNEDLKWFQLLPTCAWKHYEKTPSGLKNDIWMTMKKAAQDAGATLDFTTQDEKLKEQNEERLKMVKAFAKLIGTSFQVDGVIAFLPSFYNDDDLVKKMDESRHLFAFRNMVVDMNEGGLVRPIKPSDYISLHTGYDYPTMQPSEDAFKKMSEILWSIWEDEGMVNYVMKTIATCLHGDRKFERFYVWTGNGRNGKGLMSEIIKAAFGDYYKSIPHECLTKTADKKGSANPEIAACKGKRFVQSQEPEAEDKLQVGIIKEFTGNDDISARMLHKNPITFKPQGGLFLQTNNIPKMNKPDLAARDRMRVVPFPFKFVDECTDENHRPIDIELKGIIKNSTELRDVFIISLIKIYPTIGSAIEDPPQVKETTIDYIDSNNPVKEWIEENYKIGLNVEDKKFWIESGDLRRQFCSDTNTPDSAMSSERFKSLLTMLGVKQKRMGNKFKSHTWDEYSKIWKETERKSGMFWMGICSLEAQWMA